MKIFLQEALSISSLRVRDTSFLNKFMNDWSIQFRRPCHNHYGVYSRMDYPSITFVVSFQLLFKLKASLKLP